MNNKTCASCRFGADWEPETGMIDGIPPVGPRMMGRCHRYAPGRRDACDPREVFVFEDYWCGDFKAAKKGWWK